MGPWGSAFQVFESVSMDGFESVCMDGYLCIDELRLISKYCLRLKFSLYTYACEAFGLLQRVILSENLALVGKQDEH